MKDRYERRGLGANLSDVVVIGLAAVFALGGFYLMFGPSPLAPLYEQRKHQAEAAQPGEVSIDLKTWKAPPP